MPRNPGKPTIQELMASKTHCKYGHKFTVENTYWAKRIRKGKEHRFRMCKECHRTNEMIRRMTLAIERIV